MYILLTLIISCKKKDCYTFFNIKKYFHKLYHFYRVRSWYKSWKSIAWTLTDLSSKFHKKEKIQLKFMFRWQLWNLWILFLQMILLMNHYICQHTTVPVANCWQATKTIWEDSVTGFLTLNIIIDIPNCLLHLKGEKGHQLNILICLTSNKEKPPNG